MILDKILYYLFIVAPLAFLALYNAYKLIRLFVHIEYVEHPTPETAEQFLQENALDTEGKRLYEKLKREGKIPAGMTYEQWNDLRIAPRTIDLEVK